MKLINSIYIIFIVLVPLTTSKPSQEEYNILADTIRVAIPQFSEATKDILKIVDEKPVISIEPFEDLVTVFYGTLMKLLKTKVSEEKYNKLEESTTTSLDHLSFDLGEIVAILNQAIIEDNDIHFQFKSQSKNGRKKSEGHL